MSHLNHRARLLSTLACGIALQWSPAATRAADVDIKFQIHAHAKVKSATIDGKKYVKEPAVQVLPVRKATVSKTSAGKYRISVQIPFGRKPTVTLSDIRVQPESLKMELRTTDVKHGKNSAAAIRLRIVLQPYGAANKRIQLAPCCIECHGVEYCDSPTCCVICDGFEICCADPDEKSKKKTKKKAKKAKNNKIRSALSEKPN